MEMKKRGGWAMKKGAKNVFRYTNWLFGSPGHVLITHW